MKPSPERERDHGSSDGDPQLARAATYTPREAEDIHRLLVESVRDYAIFILDPAGRIMTWNPGAERLKGYSPEEAIGQHFSIFYPQEAIDRGHPQYELEVAVAEGRYEEEGWRLRKGAARFWANVTITALWQPDGELVGFAKVTRDLTERVAAEQRAVEDARRVAEAESASRAKSEFLAAMSHELRTPLNAIGGYVDILSFGVHGPLNEDQLAALDRIRRSQQHLLALINDLLNFSQVEAGRLQYDMAPLDLADVVDAVEGMVEPQAMARRITIEWLPPPEPVVAVADRARVEQILLNVVTNAIKYTLAGGRISVRHRRHGDWALLEVTDTGIGIPEDFLDAIFEPFTQVGRSLANPHEGTGLGLAISRDLARAMGGDLSVRSTVGEGSTFTLRLPAG